MKKNIISITAFVLSSVPVVLLAQTIDNPLKGGGDIEAIIKNILDYILYLGGLVSIFAFIYAGFLYVKAQGNETELKKAHEFIKGTVIGVAVLISAEIIGQIIKTTIQNLRS
jgi:hypothetical protein